MKNILLPLKQEYTAYNNRLKDPLGKKNILCSDSHVSLNNHAYFGCTGVVLTGLKPVKSVYLSHMVLVLET